MDYIKFGYIQKSKAFLYPLVGVPKTAPFAPTNTYMYWDGHDGMDNFELIVYFQHADNDQIFTQFAKQHILSNPKLVGCYKVEDGSVYIFDLIQYAEDVANFILGKYSEMKYKTKEKILQYHGANLVSNKQVKGYTIHIALCPQYYYKDYAERLGYPDTKYLEECVELWDIFDKEKETFEKQEIADMECCEVKQVMI
jgi:hypothetical protein